MLCTVPDVFRAADLTDTYLGRYIRVAGHEGTLRAAYVDDEYVQLLLDTGGQSRIPIVGAGAPVDIVD